MKTVRELKELWHLSELAAMDVMRNCHSSSEVCFRRWCFLLRRGLPSVASGAGELTETVWMGVGYFFTASSAVSELPLVWPPRPMSSLGTSGDMYGIVEDEKKVALGLFVPVGNRMSDDWGRPAAWRENSLASATYQFQRFVESEPDPPGMKTFETFLWVDLFPHGLDCAPVEVSPPRTTERPLRNYFKGIADSFREPEVGKGEAREENFKRIFDVWCLSCNMRHGVKTPDMSKIVDHGDTHEVRGVKCLHCGHEKQLSKASLFGYFHCGYCGELLAVVHTSREILRVYGIQVDEQASKPWDLLADPNWQWLAQQGRQSPVQNDGPARSYEAPPQPTTKPPTDHGSNERDTGMRVGRGKPQTLTYTHQGHPISVVCSWESPAYMLLIDGRQVDSGGGAASFSLPFVSGVTLRGAIGAEPVTAFVRNMGVHFRLEISVSGSEVFREKFN